MEKTSDPAEAGLGHSTRNQAIPATARMGPKSDRGRCCHAAMPTARVPQPTETSTAVAITEVPARENAGLRQASQIELMPTETPRRASARRARMTAVE